MTNYWIEVFPNGNICSCGSFPAGMYPEPKWGGSVVQVDSPCDPKTSLFLEGAIVPLPSKPSPEYLFDYESKQWFDPETLDTLMALRMGEVDAERMRRYVEPIQYLGRSLDADLTAQKNISDKLSEIKARENLGLVMPPELMLWRDADNLTEVFASMEAMKEWLQGLVVAIAQRGTEDYVWAWQTKSAIQTAQTKDEVRAIAW